MQQFIQNISGKYSFSRKAFSFLEFQGNFQGLRVSIGRYPRISKEIWISIPQISIGYSRREKEPRNLEWFRGFYPTLENYIGNYFSESCFIKWQKTKISIKSLLCHEFSYGSWDPFCDQQKLKTEICIAICILSRTMSLNSQVFHSIQ